MRFEQQRLCELMGRTFKEAEKGSEDPVVKAAIDASNKLYDQGKLSKAEYEKAVKDFLKTYRK